MRATLRALAPALAGLADDWWLIGSAAMALCGAKLTVADVDLLVSPADARRLAHLWGVAIPDAQPHPKFRSQVYFQWLGAPIPVDVMAGFEVRTGEAWRPIAPRTRTPAALDGMVFHTPSPAEQIEILALFDRPKDRARAGLLRAL